MRNKWLLLFLLGGAMGYGQAPGVVLVGTAPSGSCPQGVAGRLVNSTGIVWTCQSIVAGVGTWTALGGGGGMTWPTTPGYALWLSGATWSTPHLTDSSGTVSSSEPFAIVQAGNQLVTGTSTNTTTSTYPASSGAVTLTFPNTSEYMVGANSDTTTTHVLHATAVPGVYNSAAIAAGDIPATAVPAVAVPTPSASITLAAPSGIAVCTGTCTVSVPVPAAGYQFCILNDANVGTAITLSALGSSASYENSARTAYGTAGTGTLVLSAATGNLVCIVGRDSTHYLTTNYVGTVTVN